MAGGGGCFSRFPRGRIIKIASGGKKVAKLLDATAGDGIDVKQKPLKPMEANTQQSRVTFAAELRDLVRRWRAQEPDSDITGTLECVKADFLSPGKSLVTTPFSVEMREFVARWCDLADFSREEVVGVLEYEKFLYLTAPEQWLAPPASVGAVARSAASVST